MGIPVLFGIHCHQPVDNFKNVVDEIIEKSYKPFFEKVFPHKWFKFSVHFSGWLLNYIRVNSPETFQLMKKLANEGRIEFFTGGFYEPVLSAIPKKDRIGQIAKLSMFIKDYFGQKPKGLWLTERVWDPSIIPDIAECGVEYMLVDDYHFLSVGFHKDSLNGYFHTEQDGYLMKLFPIDQKLRYFVPFKEPEVILNYLNDVENKGGYCGILFDDGEKFGVWPKTYEWVYEKGWFDRFMSLFADSEHKFKLYSEFAEKNRPNGFAYLPLTSYMEMGEWSLFADKFIELKNLENFLKTTDYKDCIETFVKGAIWKNFLVKYPECNQIHKRTLKLSKENKGDNEKLTDLIYRAQCNDVLWHGIFGGIYLPNLRDNAYKYIIEAESIVDLDKSKIDNIYEEDILMDGYRQVVINTKGLKYIFNTGVGAGLMSLDLKNYGLNLQNTISRRFEGYHKQLLDDRKEAVEDTGISTIHEMSVELSEDVKGKIAFDWYNRYSFIDHFIEEYDFNAVKRCEFKELGDFTNQPFEYTISKNNVRYFRDGGVYKNGEKHNTTVSKSFNAIDKGISFEYEIVTDYGNIYYMLELNFHFFDNEKVTLDGNSFEGIFDGKNKYLICSENPELKIEINFSKKTPIAAIGYNVETVSQSESGVDLTLQGLSLNFIFKVEKGIKFNGELLFEGGQF
ncbi:DUF1926 domain-containing protein [Deferribacterales bacterium Es71-Z0220]|uniref:alpha-amylase/4-alpha-glucanotransferase domain-containing protein n=1 Tax=Deferrivibrio essentukiensis TaxID=2880922 RepID=UPI001F62540E|nr:alpha-amylase/4-alpha-glucanotransferase domain-containing protein [Deferrivibrio essentukiensis]MCB4203359.1 DUF1926 domain-containing protein [Deferrivibrio essentukiensis]